MTCREKLDAVEMVAQRFRFLPHLFRWRGRCYEVESVEGCRTVVRRGKGERRFRVRCVAGMFELCQDLSTGAWMLRRANRNSAKDRLLEGGRQRRRAEALVQSRREDLHRRLPRDRRQALSA